jgi:hypothetical protein
MAFLAHLQTFTWMTWILAREGTTGGSDSTRHRNPGHRCAQGSWSREASCVLLGWDREQVDITTTRRLLAEARCGGKLDGAVCCWLRSMQTIDPQGDKPPKLLVLLAGTSSPSFPIL